MSIKIGWSDSRSALVSPGAVDGSRVSGAVRRAAGDGAFWKAHLSDVLHSTHGAARDGVSPPGLSDQAGVALGSPVHARPPPGRVAEDGGERTSSHGEPPIPSPWLPQPRCEHLTRGPMTLVFRYTPDLLRKGNGPVTVTVT